MDFSLSDDTEAAELLGIEPTLVFSNRVQIKVTYPEDLLFAETLLSKSSTYK
ncbi:2-C-methyl-D-erythritol 4-phosphate cytidylyltransferase [Chlamydia trachomatis]|nr:2-C-methyl-D-erythritol 4-phosphate cytidylyltransferase [Chlamydia trachomatis]CRH48096.1 2-C-methyl-D-erythritol 4-phosphate cytidylyltransferase [Chlamydia trachomatis]CRH49066.1 2-C-methyl-D-erythritol 4-phosphate cytidylyltransferase [Chlamydia trachomatis]CRH67605.1 2-C-methyl-D-erythritol 4-phosphate cytidylyltransferase [Chlamydia trachomatis]